MLSLFLGPSLEQDQCKSNFHPGDDKFHPPPVKKSFPKMSGLITQTLKNISSGIIILKTRAKE
jgi:hypothetical protein